MSKALTETDLNARELDIRAQGKWKGEALEAFACASCQAIFIGIPDCHCFLANPQNPKESFPYNLPHESHCPKCKAVLHNPKDGSGTRSITANELADSEWNWMLAT